MRTLLSIVETIISEPRSRDDVVLCSEFPSNWIERMELELEELAFQHPVEPNPVVVKRPTAIIHPDRCVAARGVEGCLRCVAACTAGCIKEKDKGLTFDTTRCVGCGACAAVCPTCAIEATGPTDGELAQRFERACRDSRLTIMCRPRADQLRTEVDRELVAEVTCLGRIEESILIGVVSRGIREINLVHADCDRCRQNGGFRCAKVAAKSANNLLRLWRRPDAIHMSDRVPSYVFQVAAREGCVHVPTSWPMMDRVENAPAHGSGPVMSPEFTTGGSANRMGCLSKTVSPRRISLLESLAALEEPSYESAISHLWASLEVDMGKCSGCRKCVAICPTGALSRSEQETGFFGVVHRASRCVNCGACCGACPNGAITAKPKVRIADLLHEVAQSHEMKRAAMAYYA